MPHGACADPIAACRNQKISCSLEALPWPVEWTLTARGWGRGPSALLGVRGGQSDGDSQGHGGRAGGAGKDPGGSSRWTQAGNFACTAEKRPQQPCLCVRLKGQEALKAVLGNTKSGSVPSTAASTVCCGSHRQLPLQGEGSALGIALGYCLPLSTGFFLCIIYYREVSRQLSHHIILEKTQAVSVGRL